MPTFLQVTLFPARHCQTVRAGFVLENNYMATTPAGSHIVALRQLDYRIIEVTFNMSCRGMYIMSDAQL